jgi:hypothetical protein
VASIFFLKKILILFSLSHTPSQNNAFSLLCGYVKKNKKNKNNAFHIIWEGFWENFLGHLTALLELSVE